METNTIVINKKPNIPLLIFVIFIVVAVIGGIILGGFYLINEGMAESKINTYKLEQHEYIIHETGGNSNMSIMGIDFPKSIMEQNDFDSFQKIRMDYRFMTCWMWGGTKSEVYSVAHKFDAKGFDYMNVKINPVTCANSRTDYKFDLAPFTTSDSLKSSYTSTNGNLTVTLSAAMLTSLKSYDYVYFMPTDDTMDIKLIYIDYMTTNGAARRLHYMQNLKYTMNIGDHAKNAYKNLMKPFLALRNFLSTPGGIITTIALIIGGVFVYLIITRRKR